MKTIPVITLWQPWATWIIRGWKTIETKTHSRFKRLLGCRIGIHAGLYVDSSDAVIRNPYLTRAQIHENPDEVIGGYLLGTARVSNFRLLKAEHSPAALIDCGTVQRFGIFLEDVQKLSKPIKTKGAKGIWYFEYFSPL